MPADVREAAPAELSAALALRQQVFCGEQGVSLAAERDGRDGDAVHLVALDDGAVVGTCRLLIEDGTARLGRMAVASGSRGRGVGTALLAAAQRLAAARGTMRVSLHAQVSAQPFYARNGYRSTGECFMEEGMEHVAMEKTLA